MRLVQEIYRLSERMRIILALKQMAIIFSIALHLLTRKKRIHIDSTYAKELFAITPRSNLNLK